MNYNPTTRILTIDNYYDLVKFIRKQDWEFDKISRCMLVTLITHRLRRIRYQISIVDELNGSAF